VTEIPEHLLRRSKERRAALSGEEGTAEAAAVTSAPAAATAPVPATGTGGGGALASTTGTPIAAPEPEKPRIGPTRAKVPLWVMPLLIALPLWGVVYLGAFGSRVKANANDPVALGGTLFSSNCSSCHGANGEGGIGPQLNNGEVLKVWPNIQDHINWVHTGGGPFVGKSIGSLIKITVPANNVMPGFASTLSDAQIAQIVCYERVQFGGEAESIKNCPGFTG
jgi:mono/diheme cytochrome c family protein